MPKDVYTSFMGSFYYEDYGEALYSGEDNPQNKYTNEEMFV